MQVSVYNGSGQDHEDRFDGKAYEFPAGENRVIPVDAAIHIFGMGLADRSKQLIRLGWAPTSAEVPAALRRLNGFLFEQVREDEEESDPPEVPTQMEQPTQARTIDPDLAPIKARTRSVLQKAG